MTGYIALVNVPGYLPMDDEEPYVYATPREAWQSLVSEVDRAWDAFEDDPNGACLDAHTALHVQDQSAPGVVYAGTPGYAGDHDLGLAYSVVMVDDDPDEA